MTTTSRSDIASHRGAHLRVLGPPASGKTSALIERFRSLAADGLHPAVITFSRAQREHILGRLMEKRYARLGRYPVFTYHQLALEVVTDRPLGDTEERVVMARVLHDPDHPLESDYATIVGSDALARTLLSIVHTLVQNGVTPERAAAALENANSRRTRDILGTFMRFTRVLDDRGLTTYYDVSWKAARAVREGRAVDPLGDCGAVLIDDFHDIDAGQFALVEALSPPDGARTVTVFGDPTGARFGFRGTTSRFLDGVFTERYQGDDVAIPFPFTCLGDVADTLLAETGAPGFSPAGPAPTEPVVSLSIGEDEVAETQQVARKAADLIDAGVAPGDIAVVARDRGRYELVLSHAFGEYGVPLDTGRVERHELETFADAMLGLFGRYGDERLVETVVASPFYRALRAAHTQKLKLPQRRAGRDADDLKRIVTHIKGRCIDRKTRMLSMARFLDETVRAVAGAAGAPQAPVADDAIAAVAGMADEWSSYEEMTRHVGGVPDVDEFRRQRGAQAVVSLERDPRCVSFYTAREATTHSFRVVFVVGCADGVFPAMDVRESYVPYAELESLLAEFSVAFHQARDRDEKLREEYGLLLSALTRGRDQVHISAPRKLQGEELPAPSRVLVSLGCGSDDVERVDGPRTRAARVLARAGHGFDATGVELPDHRVARVWLEPALEERTFAVEEFAMSPSRLGTYVDCPRKLFYGRILSIEEEKTIHLTLGSLFHEVLDGIGKELPSRDRIIAGLTPERIAEFVDGVVGRSRDLGPEGSLVESLTRFYLEQMVSHVRAIEESRKGDYVIETELPGEYKRGGHAYRGRLDRIDSVDGKPRVVIDYKTSVPGRSTSIHKQGKSIREHMTGLKAGTNRRYWQVPMYSYGARAKDRYPDVFCYYVVPPGGDYYVSGLYVSDDPDRHKQADDYDAAPRTRPFDTVSPSDLDAVMDEVDGICDEIFAERNGFARTDDVSRCKNCYFNRVCGRRDP